MHSGHCTATCTAPRHTHPHPSQLKTHHAIPSLPQYLRAAILSFFESGALPRDGPILPVLSRLLRFTQAEMAAIAAGADHRKPRGVGAGAGAPHALSTSGGSVHGAAPGGAAAGGAAGFVSGLLSAVSSGLGGLSGAGGQGAGAAGVQGLQSGGSMTRAGVGAGGMQVGRGGGGSGGGVGLGR